ncbi:MAG: hypothetical protein ABIK09_08565 [Pseudomonadota bacterium]
MPRVLRTLLPAIIISLLLAGCSGAGGGSSGSPLQQSVTMYNEMLRWGTPMGGLEYVAIEARDDFVRAIQEGSARARVLEVEIQAVRMGPKGETAEVFVSFLWTAGDSITTVASVQRQTWKRTKKVWRIHESSPVGDGQSIFTY